MHLSKRLSKHNDDNDDDGGSSGNDSNLHMGVPLYTGENSISLQVCVLVQLFIYKNT